MSTPGVNFRAYIVLIFINGLPLHMEYCGIGLFADDVTFHANGKTKSEVEPKLQNDGNNSKPWAKHHKMQIHYNKTSCMTPGSRHRTQNEESKLDITIDGNEIKQVDKQKLYDEKSVVYSHSNEIPKKFAVYVKERQDRLPTMYWLPKLHKRPYKARFIANSSSCTTTELSKLLTSCLTAIKTQFIKYCV